MGQRIILVIESENEKQNNVYCSRLGVSELKRNCTLNGNRQDVDATPFIKVIILFARCM